MPITIGTGIAIGGGISVVEGPAPPGPPPTVVGQAYGGGFYAGQIGISSVATHYLVIAPLSSGQSTLEWKNARTTTPGADSNDNGVQNTADMVADGSSTVYPSAHFCNDLSTGGQTDWYMPAKNELDICYFNLKPTTQTNGGPPGSGINPNAVPARASSYTAGNPAQTSAAAFQFGGSEAFTAAFYWCSTEYATTTSRAQSFSYAYQTFDYKNSSNRVRAVRKVAI